MINTQELEKAIKTSGKQKGYLSQKLGISSTAFTNKLNNRSPFKVDEMRVLRDELDIGDRIDDIFFA